MKAVLIVLAIALASACVLASDVDVESQDEMVMEVDEQGKPKMVPAKVYGSNVRMYPLKVVMVPKGDPRARRPVGSYSPYDEDEEDDGLEDPRYNRWGFERGQRRRSWFDAVKKAWQRTRWGRGGRREAEPWSSDRPVLQAGGGQCAARGGVCGDRSACTAGTVVTGLCSGPASVVCCVPTSTTPTTPTTPPAPTANCPVYASEPTFKKTGNQGKSYDVVWIARDHLSDPAMFQDPRDDQMDNTAVKTTACAFARMAEAAAKDGVRLTINSGFRTIARQNYFWRCYTCQCCNNGNLAAKPGNSNHGFGLAMDLNTNCGGQGTASHPPSLCKSSAQYMWLLNNAQSRFGFIRTVQKEPWHWEYRPGSPNPSWAKF